MIVDRDTLDVLPITDKLLFEVAGSYEGEIDRGSISWSNELVLHVVELKTSGPSRDLYDLHIQFQQQIDEINERLQSFNARLMPGAMHPWMDPDTEMKLWPHDFNPVYEAYNRIFDCRGHGWANLQSTHINLPFSNDEEFEKLHAAVRVLLPLLPGIAAGSPVADLKKKSCADYRLEAYRTNSEKIPSVSGRIIPEAVFSEEEYDEQIFQPMYRDIAPHDPDKLLQEEWLNSRGAIARFDRGSIEIRVLDIQECAPADLAIVRIITDSLKALVGERWSALEEQKAWDEIQLQSILLETIKEGEKTRIDDGEYLSLFGVKAGEISAGQLWRHLFDQLYESRDIRSEAVLAFLDGMIAAGSLSTRIRNALPDDFSEADAKPVFEELCQCLKQGTLFRAHD